MGRSSLILRLELLFHANTLLAGSGLDWFWETYAKDTTTRKPGDLLN